MRPFSWSQGWWGAFEIGARISHLDLNDEDIRGGIESNLTLGLNWHMLSNLRFTLNAIYGRVNGEDDLWIGQTRFQIDF